MQLDGMAHIRGLIDQWSKESRTTFAKSRYIKDETEKAKARERAITLNECAGVLEETLRQD